MSKQLFKSTAIVGSMTLLSRILGFVRDMLIGQIFGVNAGTDAFFLVFKIPDFLRGVFAEGAFSQAFMPVLVDYKTHKNQSDLKAFVDKSAGTLTVILIAITILGVSSAPVLIGTLAYGFQGAQHDLAVQLLQIMLPYILFVSLVAFTGTILNAYGHFALPAFTPVLLNFSIIIATLHIAPLTTQPMMTLAWSVLLAGSLQAAIQLPMLKKLKLLPYLKIDFEEAGVKRVIQLTFPALLASSTSQISFLINILVASNLSKGSVSWLQYSEKLVDFPLGILGIAFAVVILPRLSKNYAAKNSIAFSNALDWGLRFVLLVAFPAALGLFLLAEPILSTLFQYKQFNLYDVQMASKSLMAYSVGLIGFILIKILVTAFSSRADMKTPVRFGFYALLVNGFFYILFYVPLAHTGLALATSLGALFNAALLLWRLLKDKIYQPLTGWGWFLSRLLIANALMASGLIYFVNKSLWNHWTMSNRLLHLGFYVFAAILVYGASLVLLGFRPRQFLIQDS